MPYAEHHKQRTRERIVRSAYELFSKYGYDSVSIESIMKNCSLTRGGFYSYFSSKGELYKAAMNEPHNNSLAATLLKSNHYYLNTKDLLNTLLGAVSLGHLVEDINQKEAKVREAYSYSLNQFVEQLQHTLSKSNNMIAENQRQQSLLAAAMLIGTQAVINSVDDSILKQEVLIASERFIQKWAEESVSKTNDAFIENSPLWLQYYHQ